MHARHFRTVVLLTAAAIPLATSPVAAQEGRTDLLVSPGWLAEHLEDPDLILLHVGPQDEYASEHIAGARYISIRQLAAPEDHDAGVGLSLQMPAPVVLADSLGALGIDDRSRIVVYFAGEWITAATRVMLTLDWIGLGARSSLLDGGLAAWKAEGRPVSAEAVPPAAPNVVTPRVRDELIVTAEWVRDHLDDEGTRVIDARAPVHYDGLQPTYLHRQPVRKGHIPGAANVPFTEIVDDQIRLKSPAELTAIFDAAGVEPGDTVVGYCHLGQFATLMLFGARTLGYPVRLYDGSFQEWGSRDELPVEGPASGS
jgi:thiosulfate/3-mercaptopyruvate sulfurtransferase